MLGDVGADVVCSAMGWFNPGAVKMFYDEGVAVAGPATAAQRMAEAHAMWGQKYLGDIKGLDDIVAVTETLVDGLEGSAIPLFAGWRATAKADDPAGRAAQLMQMLREWRGGLHLVATTAVGLSPLEAILTNEGEGQAKFFGWPEPFPDCQAIGDKHQEAEDMTDRTQRRVSQPGPRPRTIRSLRGRSRRDPFRGSVTFGPGSPGIPDPSTFAIPGVPAGEGRPA